MNNTLSAQEIRKKFLDFFKSKNHKIVPSAPIVVKNDPTLLFTNAGMNQFKDIFLGNKTAEQTRVADTQKCLRVSGKHNDLEEVGVDTYHHTMFEMLGNWSFGDYFKKEAIEWSWEFLTDVLQIPKDRLYVTVFEGDEKENLPFDSDAFNEWKKWIAEDRILKGSKKDNFWEMGDTGPCGPCSEIHVDCRNDEERNETPGANLVNADHPQVIEIWNNVFMEFNRMKDGSLQALPAKHVDTGMGFERLVRVIQGKQSNYDTDIFLPTIHLVEKITGKKYTFGDTLQDISFRVLADHIRAIIFTIADGQLPAANGAGYVIRRILRRAIRYYYSYLEYQQPLLHQLVGFIAEQFKEVFPEVLSQQSYIEKVIKEEENSFLRTLEKGIKRFEEYASSRAVSDIVKPTPIIGSDTQDIIDSINRNNNVVDGKFAFELYDTYGFPLDLTELMAREKGLIVDTEAFAAEMQIQKDRSRKATILDTGDWNVLSEDSNVTFIGYSEYTTVTKVIKYRKVSNKGKEFFQIVLEKTPFYPEGGGQIGDTGCLIFDDEVISVFNTKKENDLIVHFTENLPTSITSKVTAKIDFEKRIITAYNHTATHLLHAALKQVVGEHVNQKGSLVSDEVLRFDISHFSKLTDEEIHEITLLVNQKIRENIPVIIKEMSKDEAIEMGAMALFGEKYGDVVRTVIIDPKFSVELCGGTHVANTGEIGTFVITAESAVAAGVRRIEALTGLKAIEYLLEKNKIVNEIAETMKTKDVKKSFLKLMDDKAVLEKKIDQLEQQAISQKAKELQTSAEKKDNYFLLVKKVEIENMDALKKLTNDIKTNLGNAFVLLYSVNDSKPMVALAIGDALSKEKNLNAGQVIKAHIAPKIKGGGGGSPLLASAGGSDVKGLEQIGSLVDELLK